MVTKEFSSASELLDYFYFQRDKTVRLKQRANDLFKFLANTSERITKRLAAQQEELKNCEKKDQMKLMGDLISANIYRLKKGDERVKLENFYDERFSQIEIKLDPRPVSYTHLHHIDRGYEDMEKAFSSLGGKIQRV